MPGSYLLDTAPLLQLMGEEEAVPAAVRRALAEPASEVFFSQISLWEIQIKYQLGKLTMTEEPSVLLPRELAKYSFTKIELTDAAIFGLSRLPAIHRDPFDRILIVQAKLTGCTLVTPDQTLARYPVEVFW